MELIELHILQSFPVTCLNRDDVGAPKTAYFGGCQRARVSSQCWKRAIRTLAKEYDADLFAGERTRYVIRALREAFLARGRDEQSAQTLAEVTADALGKLDDAEKGNVKTLLYFSPMELDAVVDAMLGAELDADLVQKAGLAEPADEKAKKEAEKARADLVKSAAKAAKALGARVKDAADIAIFGRMVADDHSLMVEGAGLFSHALSTHKVANEIDFFSAVDDENVDDEGAGHIGTLEFNSACYYRYVGLNTGLLADERHLEHFSEDERAHVVNTFLKAAILAVPVARKNSMFGFNPPASVLGLRRRGQPLSLVNAFEIPVRSGNGYLEESKQKLLEHWQSLKKIYNLTADVEAELPPDDLATLFEKLG